MKTFKDTKYGDLSGEIFNGDISVSKDTQSLEGAPKIVKGDFDCSYCNRLNTLKHSPEIVEGKFICKRCKNIEYLDCKTKVVKGFFNCSECNNIKSLQGAPEIIEGDFNCYWCDNLETLEGAPKKCKAFNCVGCDKLKNLNPLLKCDIEDVIAEEDLLEDYYKKKTAVEKYGYEQAMEIFDTMDDLL